MIKLTSFNHLVTQLKQAGIERPWRELRLLATWASGCSYEEILLGGHPLEKESLDRLEGAVRKRCLHWPLTKIVGQASFWKYAFVTTEATLDPRPESELFVTETLSLFQDTSQPLRFLELGTGTGCLILSLLGEYRYAHGLAVDLSEEALQVARGNANRLKNMIPGLCDRIQFLRSDWFSEVSQDLLFDVILTNPPYIPEGCALQPEVLRDPPLALFGGTDGLDAFRTIFASAPRFLASKGFLLVEFGQNQAGPLQHLAAANGLDLLHVVDDFNAQPRLAILRALRQSDLG